MAEAFLRERLEARGVPATVHSAGLLNDGAPANDHGVAVMAGFGLDLKAHRSRLLTEAMIQGADLVLGMARDHVRQAVVLVPEAWPRAFTIKELVRRGGEIGPRKPAETVAEWLGRAHAGREHADLLGQGTEDDVFDPIGFPRNHFKTCAVELKGLVGKLVDLVHPEEVQREERR